MSKGAHDGRLTKHDVKEETKACQHDFNLLYYFRAGVTQVYDTSSFFATLVTVLSNLFPPS